MDFKKQRNLLQEAMDAGCTTVGQLAIYLRVRARIAV